MGSGIVGPGGLTPQIGVQQARETQLLQQMKSASGPDQKEKIEKSAREFEALLLSGWLQQAEQSLATVPGADDDQDADQRDQIMSLGAQSLAGALAASGGIGIGAMLEKAMLAMAQKSEAPAASTGAETPAVEQHFLLNSGLPNADRMGASIKRSE
jgi:Rod binding domain-containing protein